MTKFVVGLLFVGLIIWGLVTAGRAMMQPTSTQAMQITTNTQYASPTFQPTATVVPTATIGYEATVVIAQMTADEARRVNAEVTSAAEQRLLDYAHLTAVVEDHNYQIASWTQEAARTSIPLTATAQMMGATQIAEGQRIVASALTATNAAPTQYAAMIQLETTAKFIGIGEIMKLIALGALILFLLSGTAYWVTRSRQPAEQEDTSELSQETVVHIRHDRGQGDFSQVRLVVPCTPEQLTELAELAVNGEKKFGINRLEQTSRTFKSQRETLLAVRQFLLDNHFVISDGNGTITLNANGEAFLIGWFEYHKLPIGVEFAEKVEESVEAGLIEPEEVEAE